MIKKKAVIFDMDGVIVDSMPYHYLAWYEALRPFGVRVTCFDVYAKEGERWQKSLEDFLLRAGKKPTKKMLAKIFLLRRKIFKRYFKRYIFSGAQDFLACLKRKGYLLGLVTGTPEAEIKKILSARLRGLFDCIIAGDHVKNGKPHPEPYLNCAKMLGLRPGDCAVVENAPYGIESAKRAGMFCFAVSTSLPKEYLKKADVVVERLEDITKFIEGKCKI